MARTVPSFGQADEKGPSASWAPSVARSTYREYASRATSGAASHLGPFDQPATSVLRGCVVGVSGERAAASGRTSSKGPDTRTISLSVKVPRRMTITNRSPAMPARRVASVSGAKITARGASPSVNEANSVDGAVAAHGDADARSGGRPRTGGRPGWRSCRTRSAHAGRAGGPRARRSRSRRCRAATAPRRRRRSRPRTARRELTMRRGRGSESQRGSSTRPAGSSCTTAFCCAVGDVEIAGGIERHALGLLQERGPAGRGRAAGHQLGAAVDDAIEHAEAAIAIVRRDEQLVGPRERRRPEDWAAADRRGSAPRPPCPAVRRRAARGRSARRPRPRPPGSAGRCGPGRGCRSDRRRASSWTGCRWPPACRRSLHR